MQIKTYLTTLVTFLALDAVWLLLVAPKVYKKGIGHLMANEPNLVAAGIFYLIFIFGLVYFAVQPAIESGTYYQALIKGALFGFIAYSTYDLTNLATLKDWPIWITLMDMTWGTFLGGLVSWISYLIQTSST